MIDALTQTAEEIAYQAMLQGGKDLCGRELLQWYIGAHGEEHKQESMNKLKEAIQICNDVTKMVRSGFIPEDTEET